MTEQTVTTPPFTITTPILNLVTQIVETVSRVNEDAVTGNLRLRRVNRIRTIRGSLAIEGNTLSEEEVSTILNGKRVIAPLREIQEVRNAARAYDKYPEWNPASEADLLEAHGILMLRLLDAPGRYRLGGIAVAGGGEVHHVGPSPNRVPLLMSNLLSWLDGAAEHPLIASSIFHYEFEFIHPFEDGNGRMGRLWQSLILTRWKPLFAHVPVESLIFERQADYYSAIRESSAQGESTPFIRYMLEIILEALQSSPQETDHVTDQETDHVADHVTDHVSPQVARLIEELRGGQKSRIELMAALGLSHRPTFRSNYLRPALEAGFIEMTNPESPRARNQMYRLTAQGRKVAR